MSAADDILAMEQARNEENRRFNTERKITQALAPDRWTELKRAFITECQKLSDASYRFHFECAEPDSQRFFVNRILDGEAAVAALEFRFDPIVPRIVITDHWTGRAESTLNLTVHGSSVYLTNGGSGVILSDLVRRLMIQVTRK